MVEKEPVTADPVRIVKVSPLVGVYPPVVEIERVPPTVADPVAAMRSEEPFAGPISAA